MLSNHAMGGKEITNPDEPLQVAEYPAIMERLAWTGERLEERFNGIDLRFDAVDRRFEEVDRRFQEVDRRFDRVDRRLDRVEAGLRDIQMTLNRTGAGIIIGLAGVIAAVFLNGGG
jgi:hypothetical protein